MDVDQNTMNRILMRIGALIKERAITLAPIDMGDLRRSIQFRTEGNKVIISVGVDYAEDLEYGKAPGILDENEKQELTEWADRHNLPGYLVIKKIEREGIKVGSVEQPMRVPNGTYRPFIRPAIHQCIPDIKRIIREELE